MAALVHPALRAGDSVGDPSATRTVYVTVVLLALLGVVFVVLAVWMFRATRPDRELLAPLEEMDRRAWRRLDPATRRRRLDDARPDGAAPLSKSTSEPSVDQDFAAARPVASFDDLADDRLASERDESADGDAGEDVEPGSDDPGSDTESGDTKPGTDVESADDDTGQIAGDDDILAGIESPPDEPGSDDSDGDAPANTDDAAGEADRAAGEADEDATDDATEETDDGTTETSDGSTASPDDDQPTPSDTGDGQVDVDATPSHATIELTELSDDEPDDEPVVPGEGLLRRRRVVPDRPD